MEQKNLLTIDLGEKYLKDIKSYCNLNEIDYDIFVKKCFDEGYKIEKYGLLSSDNKKIVEVEKEVVIEKPIEVIKEVVIEKPVEIIREVIIEKPIEIINEVIIEKPIEIINEVIVEKPVEVIKEVIVEKEVFITNDEEQKQLALQIKTLLDEKNQILSELNELKNKEPEIIEIEKPIEIVKEIIVEKPVEVVKEIVNTDKQIELQNTISLLRNEVTEKDEKILQLEKNLLELKKIKTPVKGMFMGSSNLNDNLYK